MLRWTLALLLGLIIACANAGGGGEEITPLPPGPTPRQLDTQTFGDRKSGAPELTPKIGATSEAGTAQVDTRGQTPAASRQGTPTLEVGSQLEAGSTPAVETELPRVPVVTLGGVPFRVELGHHRGAANSRAVGPSAPCSLGRDALRLRTGAKALILDEGNAFPPLDMIWIDAECTVVHITRNAPPQAPKQALADLPLYGPPVPVLYVLEINAGEAESARRHRGKSGAIHR